MVLLGDVAQLEARFQLLMGDKAQIEAHFSPFRAVIVSVQDRCTVCAKCSIASEIILDTPDGTPR
jgi:hypothetical protein